MALIKPISYKGIILPEAYFKITAVLFEDIGKRNEDNVKLYTVYYQVNSYTNPTKEYDIEQKEYITENIGANISIADGYTYLKTLPEFEGATDI